jgi:hypothetical protein
LIQKNQFLSLFQRYREGNEGRNCVLTFQPLDSTLLLAILQNKRIGLFKLIELGKDRHAVIFLRRLSSFLEAKLHLAQASG